MLMIACKLEHYDIVKMLLENGAHTNLLFRVESRNPLLNELLNHHETKNHLSSLRMSTTRDLSESASTPTKKKLTEPRTSINIRELLRSESRGSLRDE